MMEQKLDVPDGTDKEYNLICKVSVQKRSYYEIADRLNHETFVVLLLPRIETTEASRFFVTYLPDIGTICMACKKDDLRADHQRCPHCDSEAIKTEHTEVVGWLAHPVDSPSRLALLRKNNYCGQHHLFVMGTGAEKDLLEMDGKEIHVKIFSSLEDAEADNAKSVEKEVSNQFKNQ